MALIDTSYLSAFQNHQIPDYVSMFTRGFNLGNALPWSAENTRKRQIEDFQLQARQQAMAQQAAAHAQEMQIKQSLLPYQIARYKQLSSNGTSTGSDADRALLERVAAFGQPQAPTTAFPFPDQAPLTTNQPPPIPVTEQPLPQQATNINFDPPVF